MDLKWTAKILQEAFVRGDSRKASHGSYFLRKVAEVMMPDQLGYSECTRIGLGRFNFITSAVIK
jgi:hypothetical protein